MSIFKIEFHFLMYFGLKSLFSKPIVFGLRHGADLYHVLCYALADCNFMFFNSFLGIFNWFILIC